MWMVKLNVFKDLAVNYSVSRHLNQFSHLRWSKNTWDLGITMQSTLTQIVVGVQDQIAVDLSPKSLVKAQGAKWNVNVGTNSASYAVNCGIQELDAMKLWIKSTSNISEKMMVKIVHDARSELKKLAVAIIWLAGK